MRTFDLFCSHKCGEPSNTVYKNKRTITNTSELKAAVTTDHVAAAYKKNTRKNENFIQSNCVMFDVDNTDTDAPGEWITSDKIRVDFPEVEYYLVTSRNHMKEKDGKAPRPKYHVYFPLEIITDGAEYTALKRRVKELFTYFDKQAADTARFFYGNPAAEVLFFEGVSFLAEYIGSLADITIPTVEESATQPANEPTAAAPIVTTDAPPPTDNTPPIQPPTAPITTAPGAITAGSRNSTMSVFAFTMLKKYGDCEKSRREFAEQSKKCTPPLEVKELQIIWEKAVQSYLVKIAGRSDYIPPREYAQWGEIQPIDAITPPTFPFSAFPVTLSNYTQSVSEYTQTAPEMAGVLILGALGAVFQKKYNVQSINKNIEQLSIYAVAISPPAERKSEVIRHIITPFINYQNKHNRETLKAVSESEAKRKELKTALFKAEGEIDGTESKRQQLIDAQYKYDNFTPIHALTLLADDTTTEALITLMVKNGERMFIASGEGGLFSNMKGRYRSGDDMEIYLKGHSGDYISIHRKSREPEILHSPALSLAICVQPYIIHNVLMDEENNGKGLTGRIIFAYPAGRAGTRKAKSKTPPDKEGYDKVIFYALEKTVAMEEPKTIKLSDQADEYAENYFYTPEKRIEDGLETAMSWNGKAFGLCIRIAALFHAFQCCEDGKEPAEIPVSLETMQNAVKITECLAVHAEKVFAGDEPQNNDALYLLRRIKRYGQREIKKQKMWRGVMSRFRNAERLDDTLSFLEGRGYLRVEKSATGGRPAEIIKVNPAVLGDKPVQEIH